MSNYTSEDMIDEIFDTIDDLMLDGDFDKVDDILKSLDPTKMIITEIVAYLSITLCAKDNLAERKAYFKRAKIELEKREPQRAESLLKGLE